MKAETINDEQLVDKLNALLKDRKISQTRLAEMLNWERVKVNKIVNGKIGFSFKDYMSICKVLDIEPYVLLDYSKEHLELRDEKGKIVGVVKKNALKNLK